MNSFESPQVMFCCYLALKAIEFQALNANTNDKFLNLESSPQKITPNVVFCPLAFTISRIYPNFLKERQFSRCFPPHQVESIGLLDAKIVAEIAPSLQPMT